MSLLTSRCYPRTPRATGHPDACLYLQRWTFVFCILFHVCGSKQNNIWNLDRNRGFHSLPGQPWWSGIRYPAGYNVQVGALGPTVPRPDCPTVPANSSTDSLSASVSGGGVSCWSGPASVLSSGIVCGGMGEGGANPVFRPGDKIVGIPIPRTRSRPGIDL